jgi:putative transport protein
LDGGDPPVQSIGFILFIFSVGFQAGPRFFSVIRQDGLRYLLLALVVSGSGFVVATSMSVWLGLKPGAAAGVLAGGLTSSPTLAAAQEAIRSGSVLPPPGVTADQMLTNISTGYAITYIFGLVGLIVLIRLIPKLTGVDLAVEASQMELEEQSVAGEGPDLGVQQIVLRAYRVTRSDLVGRPFRELAPEEPGLVAVHKIKRGEEVVAIGPETVLQLGDRISLLGFLDRLRLGPEHLGPEITDRELLDVATESCQVVVTSKKAVGQLVSAARVVREFGCILSGVNRSGVAVPMTPQVQLQRGDVLDVTGPHGHLDRLRQTFGHVERQLEETDLLTFALGIASGIVVGSLSVRIGGVSVGLGSAGGLLAAGLTIGFLRSIYPCFGRIPSAARYIFMELGLLFFMIGVGLRAGRGIVEAVLSAGPLLFLAGALTTVIPVAVGYWVGRKLLGIKPALLLGGITGAMTSGACLSIVSKEADSHIPALGYTGAYAFANVLLTVAGSLILLF